MLCFAAKWEDEEEVHFFSEFHDGRQEMLAAAHQMLSEADCVVDYNGTTFDQKWANGEFAREGLAKPAPFQRLDILSTVKKNFRFPSNKLQYVAEALGLGSKVKHQGFDLWKECLSGDEAAWEMMWKYNVQDVILLEDLFHHLRDQGWVSNHPNRQLIDGIEGCPTCASADVQKRGYRYTSQGQYQRLQCQACKSWFTETRRVAGSDIRGLA